MPIRIGFSGTRFGMTLAQKAVIEAELQANYTPGSELHFGDCLGADEEAAGIARKIGYKLICHPPTADSQRAFVQPDILLPPKPYLVRNQDIVNAVDVLFTAPHTGKE